MPDAPKTFWIFAGIGVLVISAAFAYRILQPSSSGTLDIGDLKVEVNNAQQGISAAQSNLQAVTEQVTAQTQEIAQLRERLELAQGHIRQLVAEIQQTQASSTTKNSAQKILNEQASEAALPHPPEINVAQLKNAQTQLRAASASVTTLESKIKVFRP